MCPTCGNKASDRRAYSPRLTPVDAVSLINDNIFIHDQINGVLVYVLCTDRGWKKEEKTSSRFQRIFSWLVGPLCTQELPRWPCLAVSAEFPMIDNKVLKRLKLTECVFFPTF